MRQCRRMEHGHMELGILNRGLNANVRGERGLKADAKWKRQPKLTETETKTVRKRKNESETERNERKKVKLTSRGRKKVEEVLSRRFTDNVFSVRFGLQGALAEWFGSRVVQVQVVASGSMDQWFGWRLKKERRTSGRKIQRRQRRRVFISYV